MKAIVQDEYGPPDVLRFTTVDDPVPGEGDVLLRVRAAAVHPGDYIVMTGMPYLARLAFGVRRPKVGIPGRDVAGVVETVGAHVTRLRAGDEVFGWTTTGALAELVSAGEGNFVSKPSDVSFEQAAAVTVSATTALQALRDKGGVKPGHKVLVIGASGGVGHFAVQIARWLGAEVTAVCSTANVEMVQRLGAHRVVDYTTEDVARIGTRFDFILDNAASHSLSALRRMLTPGGILVPNNGTKAGRWSGGMGRTLGGLALFAFGSTKMRPFVSKQNGADLAVLRELIAAGEITPVVDRTYPLSDGAEALGYVGEGHARGKVVVTV